MKHLYLLCLLAPFLLAADWPNEPAGSQRVVDCKMDLPKCAGQYTRGTFYDGYGIPLLQDASEPVSPPSFARARLPDGHTSGGGEVGWWDSEQGSDLYMAVDFRLNREFGSNMVGKNKIFFLRAMNNKGSALKTNGVFMFDGGGETKRMHWAHNTGELNHGGICSEDIGGACYPNRGSGTFKTGEWVMFEACVSGDGTVKWWINNRLDGDYSGLNQGTVFNEWMWNQTWDTGRNGQGFTRDAIQDLGHVVLSVGPRGMCRTGGTRPPVTPGTILDLKVTVTP